MPRQDVAVELFYDGAWHDLVIDDAVLADTQIKIMRGDGDESAAMRPTSITMRLLDFDEKYRTTNPESPLYGKAGVNTPLRVSVGGVVRGCGEVTSWRSGRSRDYRRTPRRGSAWVDLEANGLSWRINQWSQPIESPMVRGVKGFGAPVNSMWPLEDESDSTILTNVTAGGVPGQFSGVDLGDDERPAGASRTARLRAGGRMTGRFLASTGTGWQFTFASKLAAIPGSATYQPMATWQDTMGRRWSWEANNANFAWFCYAADGTLLGSSATAYGSRSPNLWNRYLLRVQIVGANVQVEPSWYTEGEPSQVGTTWSFAGTNTGRLRDWAIDANTHTTDGWYVGVFGVNDYPTNIFSADGIQSFNGYVGERAGIRFGRLMNELGLNWAFNGTLGLSTPMGAQPSATFAEILREIRDTDDAILFESKTVVNFVLSMRNYRLNLAPALTLDIDGDNHGFPTLPEEVTDDLPIHNVVTASNRFGGEFTASDTTSPMGTAPPPAGRGEYRQTVDLNVADQFVDLEQQANWWLNRGTVDLPRFPAVTINLAALHPDRIAEIEVVTIGSVIEIVGYREYTIRMHVIGYTETIGTHARKITYVCAPNRQFDVGTYDDGVKRYDSGSTTLKADVSATDTALIFRTVDPGDLWSTVDTPYDVIISGQRQTITTMGAAVLVAGAYDQAATAVRGVDGVRKGLAAGDSIHVATPGRWGLQ